MALKIKVDTDKDTGRIIARERLFETKDRRRLVPQSDPEAGFLFCTPGQPILMEDAIRFGLVRLPKDVAPNMDPPKSEKREASTAPVITVPDVSEIEKAEKELNERLAKEEADRQEEIRKQREQQEEEQKQRFLEDKERGIETK